jgi:UDP-N-acetylmuramate dehydrogenase
VNRDIPPHIREHVPLAPRTTLGLGGEARYFATCTTEREILGALAFAGERGLRCVVLGGGSNVVVRDEGIDGVVIYIATEGIVLERDDGRILLSASAGEGWDRLVEYAIRQGLAGLECLSGIPGSVGAAPIQNIGAYGQEVSQTIAHVIALDVDTRQYHLFPPEECAFGYRTSRFKREDAGKFIVVSVSFSLSDHASPTLEYPELRRFVATDRGTDPLPVGEEGLRVVRNAVLALRKKKSMVLDPADPNCRSAGSFFTNPIVPPDAVSRLRGEWPDMPVYPFGTMAKLSAAWLVEHAGFPRGYRQGGAAVSENHALALVNRGTTAAGLLNLAENICDCVFEKFGIRLEQEPVILG